MVKLNFVYPSTELQFDWNTAIVIPVFEKDFPVPTDILVEEQQIAVQSIIDREIFSGKEDETYFIPSGSSSLAGIILCGLGPRESVDIERVRRLGGNVGVCAKNNKITRIFIDCTHFTLEQYPALLEGILLSQFTFDQYKTRTEELSAQGVHLHTVTFVVAESVDVDKATQLCEQAQQICEATNMIRRIVSSPANEITPQFLAEFAHTLCEKTANLTCKVLSVKDMEQEGLQAILAVGKGATNKPVMIVLEYIPSDTKITPIVLAGKGVTFDAGGIQIKPGNDMHEMRYDMAGAGAVLGALFSAGNVQLPIPVVGIIPAVENLPSGSALLPGDIIKTHRGLTVEVLNTDAEGRLILADAISYAQKYYNPMKIVDIATLTGGCITALGHFYAGIVGNDRNLIDELIQVGRYTGERLWELPLDPDFEQLIKSQFADIANIGPKGEASTIIGGIFLKQFIPRTIAWAHIDIAGTAWGVKHIPYWNTDYPTGFGVRLLSHWLIRSAQGK